MVTRALNPSHRTARQAADSPALKSNTSCFLLSSLLAIPQPDTLTQGMLSEAIL